MTNRAEYPGARSNGYDGLGTGKGRADPVFVDMTGFSKNHFVLPPHYTNDIEKVLLPHGMIEDRIEKLAFDIKRAYGNNEIHLICILKGSRWFFGRLLSCLNKLHTYGCPESKLPPYMEHYIRVKSYINQESGNVQVIGDDLSCLENQHVLIIEDIIDTGNTLTSFCEWLKIRSPASIGVASLLEKRTPKSNGFAGDFVGFSVPDAFVVGFSLDYNELYRDLEHICVLNQSGQNKYRVVEPAAK